MFKEKLKVMVPIIIFGLFIFIAVIVMLFSIFYLILSFHPEIISKMF